MWPSEFQTRIVSAAALLLHTPLTIYHALLWAAKISKLDLSSGQPVTIFLLGVPFNHQCMGFYCAQQNSYN